MKINIKKIHTFAGHRDCIYALSGRPEENTVYSAGGEGYIVKWDLATLKDGQLLAKADASVYAIHYHAPQNLLIIGQNNEGIHLVDPDKKKITGSLKLTTSAIFDICSRGNKLYIATGDGFLIVADLEMLKIEDKIKLSDKSLRCIALDASQNTMAIGASDHRMYIFDPETGTLIKKTEGHKNSVFSVKYSGLANHLLSTGRDAHLNFWNVADDYALEVSIPAHMYAVNHIEFRSDFKFFATASMDKTIKIWDYDKKKLVKVIDKERYAGHLSSVNKLYWSRYHNYLVSASDDRTISVWSLELND